MTGNVWSPLSKTSTRFPTVIGASVWASRVGKKAGSPSVTAGISFTERTFAQAESKRITSSENEYLITCFDRRLGDNHNEPRMCRCRIDVVYGRMRLKRRNGGVRFS